MKYLSIILIGLLLLVSCDFGGKKKEQAEQAYNRGLKYYEAKKYDEALKPFIEAAELGHQEAQFALGLMYLKEQGVSKDCAEAMKWFKKAADQGSADGENSIGMSYFSGCGVPQDYAEAMKWFKKAADKGHVRAQFNMASLYYDGLGVIKDYNEAMKWSQKASEQKDGYALNMIGTMYHNGEGRNRDYAEAMKWYQKAVEQDIPNAMMNIGQLHEMGLGVRRNLEEASAWYKKADESFNKVAPGSYDGARKAFERVEEILTSPQTGKLCATMPDAVIFESNSALSGCYRSDGTPIPDMINMMIRNGEARKVPGGIEFLVDSMFLNSDYCRVRLVGLKNTGVYIHKKCLACPRSQTADYN